MTKIIIRDTAEFILHIYILCLFVAALFLIISQLHKHSLPEQFFSLSGSLYGPKVIPESDTCSCTQLYGSDEIFSQTPVPINKCASCHIA